MASYLDVGGKDSGVMQACWHVPTRTFTPAPGRRWGEHDGMFDGMFDGMWQAVGNMMATVPGIVSPLLGAWLLELTGRSVP